MAYEDGLAAINGDNIYDLDIGQNSLSLASFRETFNILQVRIN